MVLQYLTLLYLPYFIDGIKIAISQMLLKSSFISIFYLLFVDIEGNILFIPDIRWLFHRNDLIVAHAHVAMGVGVFIYGYFKCL